MTPYPTPIPTAVDKASETLITEVIKLLVTGSLGGLIGGLISHWLNWRHFRRQSKYEDTIRKRDALRDVLGILMDEIGYGFRYGWARPNEEEQVTDERLRKIKRQLSFVVPLFRGQNEVTTALNFLAVSVGRHPESLKEWCKQDGYKDHMDALLKKSKILNAHLDELQETLYN